MAWTTPRTWVSGELVTASMMNLHVRDNMNYLYANLAPVTPFAVYLATLLNVTNTSEIAAAVFTIPAASMSDGDIIKCFIAALAKNNKGSAGNMTFKVNVGAGAQVTIGTPTFSDGLTEYKTITSFTLMRVGSVVWIATDIDRSFASNDFGLSETISGTSTPTNFTGSNVVSLKLTLDVNHATFYYNPLTGGQSKVIHYKT